MSSSRPSTARAFTLVEMLVVLGIIGVLIALLLPAIMAAVRNARNAAIALEIKTIDQAFETYKQQRGEYPPSFGDYNASGTLIYGTSARNGSIVERHLQRCYPKFTATMLKDQFYTAAMNVDQAEALAMWLSMISTEPGNPFNATATASRHGYYEFDARRLLDNDGDGIPAYQAKYCRETDYIYVENRNYAQFMQNNCYARSGAAGTLQRTLPYFSDTRDAMNNFVGMNPKRFQIICAGQDGEFYRVPPDNATYAPAVGVTGSNYTPKQFPSGTNYVISGADRDNLTNFSEGRTLGDSRPQ